VHSCGGVNGAGGLGMKLLYGGLSLRREADGEGVCGVCAS
jgi:hypothetical protein